MGSVTAFELIRAVLILTLAYLAYVDLRTFRLPDLTTIPMLVAGLIFNLVSPSRLVNIQAAMFGALMGYVFFWALNHFYRQFKKRDGIGMGDAKLLAALGAWYGISSLPGLLLIATISALIGGVLWLRLKNQSLKAAFPFGPFLAIAGIIELLWPHLPQTLLLGNPI